MSNTQIKRLMQKGTLFVPITLSEAVVVNTSNIPGLVKLGITTLDKVLKTTLGVTGVNSKDIETLLKAVDSINELLVKKLDKLKAGTGITIKEDGTISTNINLSLYKIVKKLPEASKECENIIFLVPKTDIIQNKFEEFICIKEDINLEKYKWEKLGTVLTDIDLSGYINTNDLAEALAPIKATLATSVTAEDVTTSKGVKIFVNYEIPKTLYDKTIIDLEDNIISGQ